ncbi:hypothetical protein Ddye_020863 [Dipteronia dyeriana]|uniref:Uncharacterized protein n=1 Tax=Dipteronia dyeriana TaxID=168575 RepID=A0AAD9U1C5_9ROSI|nr:hypothetical protein Ddye_020863 [Dipteronia dyeriana]
MGDNTVFMLHESDTEFISEFPDSTDTDTITQFYQSFQLKPLSGPHVSIQILLEKYSKPIDVIVYIDTGSHNTVINPKILPLEYWKSYIHYFKAANESRTITEKSIEENFD